MNSPDYIYSQQNTIWGSRDVVGFGTGDFYVRELDRETANRIIRSNHYSGVVYAGSFVHLGLYCGSLLGVLQYGFAMNPSSQGSVVSETAQDEYLELNRMWIDDVLPRNSESKAIAYSLKYIRRRLPKIAWVQSFADERCGRYGVVYQAANFTYCGEHTSVFWELDGAMYHNSLMSRNPDLTPKARRVQDGKERAVAHSLRQFRYIYFLKRCFRTRLLLPVLPYPKHSSETT